MRKRVKLLKRQNSKFNIIYKYEFNTRLYEVDDEGGFYRNGEKTEVKPDKYNSKTYFLISDCGKRLRFKLHQIVLQTFLPNGLKDGLTVDHINRDRLDNSIYNLRFATREVQYRNRENVIYKLKKVKCLNDGKIHKSCQHAEKEYNLNKNTVSRVARGERKSIHGYKFEYILKNVK